MAQPIRGGLPEHDPDREAAGDAFGADDGSELVTGKRTTPKKGPDGKFLKADAGGGEKKEEKKDTGAPAGGTQNAGGDKRKPRHGPPQMLPDGKIRMAGKVFNDLAHLQQVFLSKAGDASTASSRQAALESENRDLRKRVVDAVSIANQYAERFNQEGGLIQQPQPQPQPQPGAPAGQETPAEPKRHFTLAAYNAMRDKFGEEAANKYAIRAQAQDREADEKRYQEMLEAKLSERLGPLEQQTKTQSEIAAARAFLLRAMPQYPELQDAATREKIVRDWMSQPEDLRYSEDLRGIRYAVLDHRHSETAQRAEPDDTDPLGDLDLPAYTLDGDDGGAGSGIPRPGDGAAGKDRDLESQLVYGDRGGPADGDMSFLPSP